MMLVMPFEFSHIETILYLTPRYLLSGSFAILKNTVKRFVT